MAICGEKTIFKTIKKSTNLLCLFYYKDLLLVIVSLGFGSQNKIWKWSGFGQMHSLIR